MTSPPLRTLAAVALVVSCTTRVVAQAPSGRVQGEAVDSSGAALPGVTVVASSTDGRILGTVTTNGAGVCVFETLPAGPVQLQFELEGFATATARTVVRPGAVVEITRRLELAPITESVVVFGKTPVAAVPPPRPAPPIPALQPVPEHDQALVCGPARPEGAITRLGTVRSLQEATGRGLYAARDQVLIDGGTSSGLATDATSSSGASTGSWAGRARRRPASIRPGCCRLSMPTSGSRFGVVVYACDELMPGDYLSAFVPEPVRAPDPVGRPAYKEAARILFGDDGQELGAPRRLMVIDQGSGRGIHAGERVTLFSRPYGPSSAPSVIGEAVVVAVRNSSATIRIERATDAIQFGDFAAPQR